MGLSELFNAGTFLTHPTKRNFTTSGQGDSYTNSKPFHGADSKTGTNLASHQYVAAVAEWYRYRIVACLVTSSSPVPLKTHRVGKRCSLNLSRAETSSRRCGVES
ncbi:histone-lysine N-methyltransferase SETMAR [Trichonephila clavipes]|nr:histone-lysine N-methyltransferase SETMAR [Trichonephila clavipes]